jgi:hypothetical protein
MLAAWLAAGCGSGASPTVLQVGWVDTEDTSGATGTTGGGAMADDRLLPLEVGRTWVYRQSAIDPMQPITGCLNTLEGSVTKRATVAAEPGKSGYDYHPSCISGFSVYVFIDGDDIRGYGSGDASSTPFRYASPPVEDGSSWYSPRDQLTFTWRDAGILTVPAGTFDRCWRRVPSGSADYIVVCRGVGLVRSYVSEDNYMLDLAQKNF